MTSADNFVEALRSTLTWLSCYAGYPRSRLAARAEILLCLAMAAEAENSAASQRSPTNAGQGYDRAALRAHVLNRSRAQFKSDNSSKV